MGKITRLPSDLANQIAAGEVVERPASVVKELIENALDAGATRIAVTVELGGKKLMRVEDNGEGMPPEDARLALERHATSKIRRADDLAAIATLGFRGEALPSIASVSHLVLRTRARGATSGTEIKVNGGVIASEVETGMAEGTVIEVADLFYNLPARRKFLKSDGAESAQISRLVTQMALAYPEVGFTLTSSGRRVLACPPVTGFRDRLYQIYGDRPDLVEVRRDGGGLAISGFVAALAEQGPVRGPQNVFVNRRIVKDRTIAHAIIDAYSSASIKERSPEVHLFIDMPLDRVDVNVHPTKAEVRFREQSLVHEVVRRAVGDAIGSGPAPELTLQAPQASPAGPVAVPIPDLNLGGAYQSRWAPATAAFARRPEAVPAGPPLAAPVSSGAAPTAAGPPAAAATEGSGDSAVRRMVPLGQFRDTFIIAVDEEGVAIVDQHVAHERILFERFMERLTAGTAESQRLLEPIVLDLPAGGREALLANTEALHRFGFDVEDFGGASLRVTAVPAALGGGDAVEAVRVLAQDLEGLDRGSRVEEALRRIAATMACHAAVKANDPLTYEKMTHLLDELRRTAYSTVCPHGRPVMLRLTRREIERNFQRI
ncbi:MAG: DNA mismatch repair endonuclease MutL [Acidobacteriota bacterium]|nr:DNA mismatch repair endonuclease MutL [Acidobacteriota bacterium]